jgi:2-succinyl-5-enolpyruvyl-6-hydroxy-3-cyclohexene-1-carboxylate synthase
MTDRASATGTGQANLEFARELVGALHAAGVATAVICPGSRSTPLAVAIAENPGIHDSVHVDERSAAFYALGHAKAAGRPVALLCTSGTAGANFLPAVAEASHSRVPLVVLTADRPPELRAWGAPQTMEQRSLYAGFTRWSEESPCPGECGAGTGYARALGRRAVEAATGGVPGPVHLNLPFREPLLPGSVETPQSSWPVQNTVATSSGPGGDCAGIAALGHELARVARGVLVCGPDRWDPELGAAVGALATLLGWPVIADPASGLRAGNTLGGNVMHGADLLLRNESAAATLSPDLVVRCGGPPTSKAFTEWLTRNTAADLWLVDAAGGFQDPQHRATRTFRIDPRQFCALAASVIASPVPAASSWLERWQRADRVARSAATRAIAAEPQFLMPHVASALWSQLPGDCTLYAANSMAIREVDTFAGPRPAPLRVLANRGVNGIDGLVSCALGAAAALARPTVLWCGDLALLHDVSGLLAGTLQHANLTIVVGNDDGGGIFEYLPAARLLPRALFERVFAVPHGLDLVGLARGLGWQATRTESAAGFGAALAAAVRGGRHLLEVPVSRAANTAFHRSLQSAVGAQLDLEFAA